MPDQGVATTIPTTKPAVAVRVVPGLRLPAADAEGSRTEQIAIKNQREAVDQGAGKATETHLASVARAPKAEEADRRNLARAPAEGTTVRVASRGMPESL